MAKLLLYLVYAACLVAMALVVYGGAKQAKQGGDRLSIYQIQPI